MAVNAPKYANEIAMAADRIVSQMSHADRYFVLSLAVRLLEGRRELARVDQMREEQMRVEEGREPTF